MKYKFDKKHILYLVALLSLMGIFAIFASYKKSKAAFTDSSLSKDDYTYLAEAAMVEGDYDAAEDYLKRMYSTVGESAKGTLCYARLSFLKGDYAGASVLYGKLEAMGETSVMADIDSSMYGKIKNGQIADMYTASAIVTQIKTLESQGLDIIEYGYTLEQKSNMEQIANGTLDPQAEMLTFLTNDVASLSSSSPRVGMLGDTLSIVDGVEEQYKSYIDYYSSFDQGIVSQYAANLDNLYQTYPDLFGIPETDEAYIRVLVMLKRYKDLAKYANDTGSQLAFCVVGQLLADGVMNENDLPKGFSTLSNSEISEVSEQCNETLAYIKKKKKKKGGELRELENNVDYISNIKHNAALVDIENKIEPESAPLKDRSALYMGKSAIFYGLGNNEMGDKYFEKCLETAPYSADPEFSYAMNNVNSAVYDNGNEDDVKGVGEYIEDAYDSSIPHSHPSEQGSGNPETGKEDLDGGFGFGDDGDSDADAPWGFGDNDNGNGGNGFGDGFSLDDYTTEDDSNLNELSYYEETTSTIESVSAMQRLRKTNVTAAK